MITNNTINDILVYKKRFPYYIVSPSYSQQSAGIKVLHYLCHHLNILGYPAFLVPKNNSFRSNPNLITTHPDNKVLVQYVTDYNKNIDTKYKIDIRIKCIIYNMGAIPLIFNFALVA